MKGFNIKNRRAINKWIKIGVLSILTILCLPVFAEHSVDLMKIKGNLSSSELNVAYLVQGITLVGGIVFAFASLFKFYRWKQNPQQVPISQGMSLLIISIIMISLPFSMTTTKRAAFGPDVKVNKLGNSAIPDLVAPAPDSSSDNQFNGY